MTTTEEQLISENSQENAVLDSQTSNTTVQSEPENSNDEAVSKSNCVQDIEIPEKFKNKDGSANINALVKSYKELEPLINEKASWSKEKESWSQEKNDLLSKIQNFENKNPFEMSDKDKALLYSKLFEKAIDKSTDSDKAKDLIAEIQKTFSQEKLKELETLFPLDVVKDVSIEAEQKKDMVFKTFLQNEHQKEMQKAENYLKEVVEKNFEELKNPAILNIFNEAFLNFGAGLDSEWFFSKINELKKSFIEDYQKSQLMEKEKNDAVSIAGKIAPNTTTKGGTPLSERNALDLSQQELNRAVEDFLNRQ